MTPGFLGSPPPRLPEFSITFLSCLPDRVTRGLLERREILGDLAPQDLLAPEEEM